MDSGSLDRTARWVQTHAVRPHSSRHHSSPSHSRSASTRHNQSVSGAGYVSQHSSQTDLDAEQPVYTSYPSQSKNYYSTRSNEQETHSRSKHSHGSRHRIEHDSQRSREKFDERGSTARQRHVPPRLNIPDELYRSPNLPAFVQGPPGSGYPMNMTTIRTPLPTSPTGIHSERAAVREPPSPPIKIPAQLNPKKSRPASDKRRPSISGTTFEPPYGYSEDYRDRDMERERRSSGHSGETRRLRKRAVSDARR